MGAALLRQFAQLGDLVCEQILFPLEHLLRSLRSAAVSGIQGGTGTLLPKSQEEPPEGSFLDFSSAATEFESCPETRRRSACLALRRFTRNRTFTSFEIWGCEGHFGRLVPLSARNQEVPSSNPGLSWLSPVVNCCALRTAYLHLRVANATAT